MHLVRFQTGGVTFLGYAYPCASVARGGFVAWELVREADPDAAPPELRLRNGEILAVPALFRAQLRAAAASAGVPIVRRSDVWDLLLEPFLDNEHSAAAQRATMQRLAESGIAAPEVEAIRKRVGENVLRYNTLHWEWVHLGLFDLLDAHLTPLLLRWLPERRRKFEEFYWWAMEIAGRAR